MDELVQFGRVGVVGRVGIVGLVGIVETIEIITYAGLPDGLSDHPSGMSGRVEAPRLESAQKVMISSVGLRPAELLSASLRNV